MIAHFVAGKALAAGGAELLACSSSLAGCGALDQEKSIQFAKVLKDEISRGGSDEDVGIMMFPSHLEPSFSALSEEECRRESSEKSPASDTECVIYQHKAKDTEISSLCPTPYALRPTHYALIRGQSRQSHHQHAQDLLPEP